MTGYMMTVEADASRRYELLQAFEVVCGRKCPSGCSNNHVYEEVGNPKRILMVSMWDDSVKMHQHLESDLFRGLKGAANILSQHASIRIFDDNC